MYVSYVRLCMHLCFFVCIGRKVILVEAVIYKQTILMNKFVDTMVVIRFVY